MKVLFGHALGLGVALALASVTAACEIRTLVPGSTDPSQEGDGAEEPATSSADGSDGSDGGAKPPGRPGEGRDASSASAVSELRFSGDCAPDLADPIVASNVATFDSIAVTNASAPGQGSVQLALVSGKRLLSLSTEERTVAKDVVNVTAGGVVYTNLCNASAGGCVYEPSTRTWKDDPVTGKVEVKSYDPRSGRLDVTFDGVVLASTRGAGLCRVSGTLRAFRLGR